MLPLVGRAIVGHSAIFDNLPHPSPLPPPLSTRLIVVLYRRLELRRSGGKGGGLGKIVNHQRSEWPMIACPTRGTTLSSNELIQTYRCTTPVSAPCGDTRNRNHGDQTQTLTSQCNWSSSKIHPPATKPSTEKHLT